MTISQREQVSQPSMASVEKTQYDAGNCATGYDAFENLPAGRLESQLIRKALGNCTGLRILDLGGGCGSHARRAVAAGVSIVDVVDISERMLQVGRAKEAEVAGSESRIRWHKADAAIPLLEQGIDILAAGQYDVVMANWVLDHAETRHELEAMWANVAAYLKPGGSFVGTRTMRAAITAADAQPTIERYGVTITDVQETEHGACFRFHFALDPPVSFVGTPSRDLFDLLDEVPRQMGFTGFATVPLTDVDLLDEDPDFWKQFIHQPPFAVVTANKA